MGWDVIVLKVDSSQRMCNDVSELATLPLGSRSKVIEIVHSMFPKADISDSQWIVVDGEGYSLQISVYEGDPVEAMLINIHGEASALDDVIRLCEKGGWMAFDTAQGNFVSSS